MLESRSPVLGQASFEASGLALKELPGFTLTQVAGEERVLTRVLGVLPDFGKAEKSEGLTLMRVGPSQIWVLGEEPKGRGLLVTPLSSGRTRFQLEGENARTLLSHCAAIDFDEGVFTTGHYVMTGIHHTPVLIHCVRKSTFHIYAMRSFAQSTWEWLVDAAHGLR